MLKEWGRRDVRERKKEKDKSSSAIKNKRVVVNKHATECTKSKIIMRL